ncbi:MAG: hypothetical protein JWR22_3572 [Herminiimonas sp.]|nr:hypothetical protein [Herminiimonas sp.]
MPSGACAIEGCVPVYADLGLGAFSEGDGVGKVSERVESECIAVGHLVRLSSITMTLPAGTPGKLRYIHCSNATRCLQKHRSLDEIPGCLLLKVE